MLRLLSNTSFETGVFAFLVLCCLSLGSTSKAVASATSEVDSSFVGKPAVSVFVRPPHVAEAVDFWSRVYSEIDTQSGFIHDNRNPQIVYEVMPLDHGDTPRQQQRDIDRRLKLYRGLLKDMAERPQAEYSSEQLRLENLWGEGIEPEALKGAAKRVRFQRGQSERFIEGQQRQLKYGPIVNAALKRHGVPAELAALPHVESSYNPHVKSHAGALGLWQIMPSTGRRYLKVSRSVDERLDVAKSTEAAARLLKHNYSVLGDWSLAVTAYNRGLAGVRRAIRASGTEDIGELTAHYEGRGFGFASRNFYAAFLAAHDVSTGQHKNAAPYGSVAQLERFLPAHLVASEFGIPLLTLKNANPGLETRYWNGEKLLPAGRPLHMPLLSEKNGGDLTAALQSLEALYGEDYQRTDRYYRIQRGDKLALLARDMNVNMNELMSLNGVRSVHRIYAGQVLQLPHDTSSVLPALQMAMTKPNIDAPVARMVNLAVAPPSSSELMRNLAERDVTSSMIYGVLRNTGARDDVVRYAYESMRLSSPSPWDIRLAASVSAPVTIPDSLRREQSRDSMLAGNGAEILQADPADYLVDSEGTIEIQVGETIGHYAHWLDVNSSQLRRSNKLRKRQHVVVGHRLQLDFSATDRATFELRRREHHESQQQQYFSSYQITGIQQHALSQGDSLWELATSEYEIPLWLLRQYNPDVDFASVLPLDARLSIPIVTAKS
ncbi:MAG: transglycosylase SLT domain-containing protein [Pseudomonadales bacterium]